tara:strand:- start:936 stop:1508 length:573 start_codon:yes stop_codon:yes gene_type:complete
MPSLSTFDKILDIAEQKVQTVGLNAFSFKDLEKVVGIKTASIHYHFPTKQDLVEALVARYIENFNDTLRALESKSVSPLEKLEAFTKIFTKTLEEDRICLCGMLASDLLSVNDYTHDRLTGFFSSSEKWLEKHIKECIQQKQVPQTVDPKIAAHFFLASLEGAMLIARVKKDIAYFKRIAQHSITSLKQK